VLFFDRALQCAQFRVVAALLMRAQLEKAG